MPRFAAIDLGSNALRLRIVEADAPLAAGRGSQGVLPLLRDEPQSRFREVLSVRAPVRLGSEVFVTGKLAGTTLGLACAALRDFRQAMDAHRVDVYRATATSAVREAKNGQVLVERARREAGIELEVIEGIEEARLIQLAVVRRLELAECRAILVDVGGGSTEVTWLDRGRAAVSMSLPMGTVRLLENFLRGAPTVDDTRRRLLEEYVDRALGEVLPRLEKASFDVLVGTGGTMDTLADLCGVKTASGQRAADVSQIRRLVDRLAGMTVEARREAYGLRPDRADTLVPAGIIFLKAAEAFRATHVVAPGVGLKEGILEELSDKHFHVWDEEREARNVLDASARIGARYHFDEAHGRLVEALATRLFDDLAPLHGLGARDRLLLRVAALLHDVGDYVRYDGHHKHSYYLILHSDIMGLSPEDRGIVANVARYHRKGPPDLAHANFRELGKDDRARVRALAALLRLADALDREHLGKVRGVRAEVDRARRRVVLHVDGDEERELEEWTLRAKSELFRDVFDLEPWIAGGRPSTPPRAHTSSRPAR